MDPIGSPATGLTVAAAEPPLARVGRDGLLRLWFERRATTTVVAGCRSTLPLQVLAPVGLEDPAAVVSILNPTGGLVGGDRLEVEVTVGAGAHACLTTPSASKVYRTTGATAEQHIRFRLEPGAILEWVPDHTIPFAGSALRQRIDVELGEDARLILADGYAAGRIARGEAWQFVRLESAIAIRDGRGWRLQDRFILDGGQPWTGVGGTEGHPYFATIIVMGAVDLAGLPGAIGAAFQGRPDVAVGVGALARGGVVVRALAAHAPALGAVLEGGWALARRALLGLPPLALRKP